MFCAKILGVLLGIFICYIFPIIIVILIIRKIKQSKERKKKEMELLQAQIDYYKRNEKESGT